MRSKQLSFQDICDLGQENIVAPDTDMVLGPTVTLCLDDMKFKESSKSMRFVHSAVSRSVAESIGISTKKRKFVQDCSRGIPFEQKEELITRLKGLLHGYPCDMGILKELIQMLTTHMLLRYILSQISGSMAATQSLTVLKSSRAHPF